MVAEVIPFPNQITCFLCRHHAFDVMAISHCLLFDERIDSEIVAARDCGGFEPA